jgi:hypothetical protein
MELLLEPRATRSPQRFLNDATQSLPLSTGLLFQCPRELRRQGNRFFHRSGCHNSYGMKNSCPAQGYLSFLAVASLPLAVAKLHRRTALCARIVAHSLLILEGVQVAAQTQLT